MLNSLDAAFVETLESQLPKGAIQPADGRYLEEPRGRYFGQPGFVAKPKSTKEVSIIVTACNQARVGVVPYGGGTGLVGGQVCPDGPAPLILSLERMNAIRGVHAEENVIIAEAGAILQNVQEAAEEKGLLFPLSLASEGSCCIGGNLATNAGGLNVLRYGNTRDLCLGLEAVLPDGQIWNGLTRLRKDNTGYDLRNLLIGSEGSLGVITAAALKLFPRPQNYGTALFTVSSPDAALELLNLSRRVAGNDVSAFELMHRVGLEFLRETLPEVRQPFNDLPEWLVLLDLGVTGSQDCSELLLQIFEDGMERGVVLDGLVAQNATQREQFWAVRERIPQANKRIGSIVSNDVSLPLSEIASFIDEGRQKLEALGNIRLNCFGHLGDGNLHFNVFPAKGKSRDEYADLRQEIQTVVNELVASKGGSFSAEHGVGRLKAETLEIYGDAAKLSAMRAIKASLDSNGIMNPGAVLR
ncbi:FAD-binding oxidoreductase [Halocynthiibacter sp. C4]|uniref:FAD-binding oxidoreductase n=1 Tax=Halocynthiibacter sp. C4 TaxID=2992758 RepID=UPI00237A51EE|nr:FAD-binding oxidoreductase [Halocynthiibacter sp. C4]MDE0588732.1 FAD-binding oxidoreductase [Halocynthiibacter sp. C4]